MRLVYQMLFLVFQMTIGVRAEAGWHYTEWGMSSQEVRTASDGKTYSADAVNSAYWEILPELYSSENFGQFEFLAAFYFDDQNGLSSVRLKPKSTIWCLDLFRYLFGKYQYQGPAEDSYLWVDKAKRNQIRLSRFSTCAITYSAFDGRASAK